VFYVYAGSVVEFGCFMSMLVRWWNSGVLCLCWFGGGIRVFYIYAGSVVESCRLTLDSMNS